MLIRTIWSREFIGTGETGNPPRMRSGWASGRSAESLPVPAREGAEQGELAEPVELRASEDSYFAVKYK